MNNFKTPSRFMAAIITLVLLGLYGLVLLAPLMFRDKPIDFDPALVQTLLTLVVVAVTFYIGTSSNSQAKDDTIAAQAAKLPPTPLGGGASPTGQPDDPVAVTQTPPTPKAPV